jgi:hypothetical protein
VAEDEPDGDAASPGEQAPAVRADDLVQGLLLDCHAGPDPDPGYATALLSSISTFRETPNDVEDAAAARMSRNHVISSPGKRFVILIEEAVLRYGVGDAETMLAQLGHLMSVTTLANVRFGIIPQAVLERPMWTVESFNVFDDATVHVELLSAQVTVTVPGEIVVYLRAFDQLARLAVYGAEARSLISSAISDLS